MDSILTVLKKSVNGWKTMDNKRKITLISIILIVTVAVVLSTYFANKKNYAVLFTDLDLEDAGYIAEDLTTKKIPYKLANSGKNILIGEKYLDSYRLQLAMEGKMPDRSTGFEIFDDIGLMATDEDRKIMYQRALSGDLQKSIMSLDAVKSAKVHLVLPEKSIFETERREGSASVIISVNPAKHISENMIRGIVALVSGAVDNLPDKNIQVINSKGELLSGFLNQEDGLNSGLNYYQRMQDSFQERMEGSLKNLLGTALGKDKVEVSVYADLDFDSEESTSIVYSDPLIRSEQIAGEGTKGGGGIIGDNHSNVIEDGDVLDGSYERTTNNELSTETKTTVKAPGRIRKITASVIYNGKLSDENYDKVLSIVAAAIGYDAERGDFISIEGLPFDTSYEDAIRKEMEGFEQNGNIEKGFIGKYGTYMIASALIFVLIILSAVFLNIRSSKRKGLEAAANFSISTRMDLGEEEVERLEVKKDPKEIKAKDFARKNPDAASELLRAWLKEQ